MLEEENQHPAREDNRAEEKDSARETLGWETLESVCPLCGNAMFLLTGFYRCPACGYKESCCYL